MLEFTNMKDEELKNKIIEYIKEKYHPLSIILHGSRANGMAREHSDWDVLIFVKQEVKKVSREIVFGANIELKQVIYPIPKDHSFGFYFRTENTNILYDPENVVPELLKKNDSKICQGRKLDKTDEVARIAFLSSALDGILDYSDNELILFDKKIDFYSRIIPSWFAFKKDQYEPSHYYAYPTIKEEDPSFYVLLQEFVRATSSEDLVKTGKKLINSIFPDFQV